MQVHSTFSSTHTPALASKSTNPNLRFQGGSGFYDIGAGWGKGLFAPITARASEFQTGADIAGYTEKFTLMAKHFVEWVHQNPINPLTLLTGSLLGGAFLTQAAGPSINNALRPGPTPVLPEESEQLIAIA